MKETDPLGSVPDKNAQQDDTLGDEKDHLYQRPRREKLALGSLYVSSSVTAFGGTLIYLSHIASEGGEEARAFSAGYLGAYALIGGFLGLAYQLTRGCKIFKKV